MKNNYFYLLLFCLFTFSSTITAQLPLHWSKQSANSTVFVNSTTALIDSDNNIYTCSNFSSNPGNYFQLLKYDELGNLLWTAVDSMNPSDYISSRVIMGDDSLIYVAGRVVYSNGKQDAFLDQYDRSGNRLWRAHYNAPIDSAENISDLMYFNGAIYLAGNAYDSNNQPETLLLKYTVNGILVWDRINNFNNSGWDLFNTITNDGVDIIVAGNTDVTFGGKFLLAKYNINGVKLWDEITTFGITSSYRHIPRDVAVDQNNNIYVANSFSNYNLVKYSSNGFFQWGRVAQPIIPTSPSGYNKVAVNDQNHIYVAGWAGIPGGIDGVQGFLLTRFSPNGATIFNHVGSVPSIAFDFVFRNSNETIAIGERDTTGPALINFDSLGGVHWTINYRNDVSRTTCYHLAIDKAENVIVTGARANSTNTLQNAQIIKYGTILVSIDAIDPILQTDIQVYPNPTQQYVTIKTTLTEPQTMKLLGTNGQLIYEGVLREQLDLSAVPKGVYFLSIQSTKGQASYKIIKN